MNIEEQYLDLLNNLVNEYEEGNIQPNRTGIAAVKLPPQMIQHDMSKGFPVLTTKQIAWETLKVELEGFIKGITSKKWFQERGCKIWDEWCDPQKVPYSTDPEIQEKMKQEDDLGSCIYGASWRNFHDPNAYDYCSLCSDLYFGGKVDQFNKIVQTLKTNPYDRRMLCVAWNPLGLNHTALPACHVLWQVAVRNGKLDLAWYQRSCDFALGVPFNIGSYALLLHLLSLESGIEPGMLTGFLMDVHLYANHINAAKEQLQRTRRELPIIETKNFVSIFDWTHKDSKLIGYNPLPAIKMDVAV